MREPRLRPLLRPALLEVFQLLKRARPVLMHQPRERAVREQAPAGLTRRAVVGLVARIADALDLRTAAWARLMITAMHRHLRTERSDAFGKAVAGFGAQAIGPFDERRARSIVEPRDVL